MIAQVTFTVVLIAIVLMAFLQLRQIPLVGAAVICAALFGGYLIWSPEQATALAHWFGVGRGTDLVLYVWVLMSFAVMLILYFNSREQLQVMTALARTIALAETRPNIEQLSEPAKPTDANP